MNGIQNNRRETGNPQAARMKVFLGYSDAAHEEVGRRCCKQLFDHLCPFVQMVVTEWDFDTLGNSNANVAAAAEARNACLAVIVMKEGESLTSGVRMWFERWCATKSSPAGVLAVVLMRSPGRTRSSWMDYSYLDAQSRAYGIHLFICSGDSATEPSRTGLATARKLFTDPPAGGAGFSEADEAGWPAMSALSR